MRRGRLEITGGFFLLLAWLNYLDRQALVPLALAACALHELGHYGTILALGGDVKLLRLTAVGAEMVLSRPMGYFQEGLAALAGPGVNLLLAAAACRWEGGLTFSGVNLVLGCFNLLPLGRLDGGRAMRCTLCLLAGPEWARRAGEWLDRVGTAALLGAGLALVGAGGNLTLLVVALWLRLCIFREKKRGIGSCQTGGKRVQ